MKVDKVLPELVNANALCSIASFVSVGEADVIALVSFLFFSGVGSSCASSFLALAIHPFAVVAWRTIVAKHPRHCLFPSTIARFDF